jgi:serine/threonine-protein kinase
MKKVRVVKIFKSLSIAFVILLILFIVFDNFLIPNYVQKGKTTRVPEVIGLSIEKAKEVISNAGLQPKEFEYKSDKRYEIGTVIMQNPIADSEVKFGRGIYLTISGGEELVEIPNLKGKSIREAAFNLERVGLRLGEISYEPSEEIFANTIIRQEIASNRKIKSGNRINVTVSQGRITDKHVVPDVSLKTLSEAEKVLLDSGFPLGKITYQVNVDVLPNTVLEQIPRAGELMQIGQTIDLVLAQKSER